MMAASGLPLFPGSRGGDDSSVFHSPDDPGKTFVVAMDTPPSFEHIFGTNSRGQDIFWWMTFAVRNSLLLGSLRINFAGDCHPGRTHAGYQAGGSIKY